jgi:hypothetical protein
MLTVPGVVNKDIYNTMQRGNNYSDFVGLANTSNFVPRIYRGMNIQQLEMYFMDECGQRINVFHKQGGDLDYLQFKVEMETMKEC